MNGIAFVVIVSQLPKIFGVSIDSVGPLRDLWWLGRSVLGGAANWTEFAIGAGALAVIQVLKPWRRIPGLLIAVVVATVVVGLFDLGASAGVRCSATCQRACPPSRCRGSAWRTCAPW